MLRLATLLTLAIVAPAVAQSGLPVDLVLVGGKIWTGDPRQPAAEALAVRGDRIAHVGSDAEVRALAGPRTRVIGLEGRRVVPGFIDSHVHLLGGGDELLGADLRDAPTMEAFAKGLAEATKHLAPGKWITSGTWDHERWPDAPLPTREVLDRFIPKNPVFVQRLDGHMAACNSLALRIAGITKTTKDPEGGTIVRAASGEPAGVLKDAAMDLVQKHVPEWTDADRIARAKAALEHAASLGITALHDMGTVPATLRVLQTLRQRGELTARITAYVPLSGATAYRQAGIRRGFGDAWLKVNGFKAFVDGSLGSTTALFFEPYADAPETRGLAMMGIGKNGPLDRQIRAAMRDGLQGAVHAIGDRANRALLDIYERRGAPYGGRPRIEHAQHLHKDDIPRFARLGVVASMQPYHAIDDGRWCEKRIGSLRSKTTYAFRDLLTAGATLAFGSDWPVAPLSPMVGIYAAVTRRTLDDKHPDGWIPAQKLTVEEALLAYTRGSARAAFDEHRTGSLITGRLADLCVLDADPLAIDPVLIRNVKVDLTLAGGKVVFERRR